MNTSLIVAIDNKGGISKNGVIPWHIKEDLQFFTDVTKRQYGKTGKNLLVMGKNTWLQYKENAKKDNRTVIVVSSSLAPSDDAYIVRSIGDAKLLADALLLAQLFDHLFVCGGKEIYNECLKEWEINQVYITVIDCHYECDNQFNLNKTVHLFSERVFYLQDATTNSTVKVSFGKYFCTTIPSFWQPHLENQYLNLLTTVLTDGDLRSTRNSKSWSVFGKTLEFDLSRFPLLTTKKVFLRGAFEELMFFLRGDTNTNNLTNKGVKIWEPNTSREFLDAHGLSNYEVGDLGNMYGYQWRHFGHPYEGMHANYENKGFDQIAYVLNLLKNDPTSRRILMTTFDPSQAHKGVLYPCHSIHVQFYVKQDADCNMLSCLMTQRSADLVCGIPINVCSTAMLVYFLCEVINNDAEYLGLKFKPNKLMMVLGDAHIYEDHRSQAIRQLLRDPHPFPQLKINRKVTNLTDFKFEDLELVDYNCYPGIIVKMVA